jgi:hypothetical protein
VTSRWTGFDAFLLAQATAAVLLSLSREFSMICKWIFPVAIAIAAGQPIVAASPDQPAKNDTGKGAEAGAVIGHEVGHGHAGAGAATGAVVGHHEKRKAETRG